MASALAGAVGSWQRAGGHALLLCSICRRGCCQLAAAGVSWQADAALLQPRVCRRASAIQATTHPRQPAWHARAQQATPAA